MTDEGKNRFLEALSGFDKDGSISQKSGYLSVLLSAYLYARDNFTGWDRQHALKDLGDRYHAFMMGLTEAEMAKLSKPISSFENAIKQALSQRSGTTSQKSE